MHNNRSATREIYPTRFRYVVVALLIANISSILAPTLSGLLVEQYGYNSMFLAAAIASVIGVIAMLSVGTGVFR